MSENRETPFANGTEYGLWCEVNCAKCVRLDIEDRYGEDSCDIECALAEGAMFDGTVSETIWSRMGGPGQKPGVIWRCPEFERYEEPK